MVATIAVYYNPAKSIGGMIESDLFCLFVSLFSSLVSLAAVGTLKAADAAGSELGDWAALFFWMGGACAVLAWVKNWLGKPSFGTACSMGFLIMSVRPPPSLSRILAAHSVWLDQIVIVKEGGLTKLLETLVVVVSTLR